MPHSLPKATRQKRSPLTGTEGRVLREHAKLTPEELAGLMDIGVKTIWNFEAGGRLSKPMARLLTLVTYPRIKEHVPAMIEYREHILRDHKNTP